MLAILSPAKTLDFTPQSLTEKSSVPEFLDRAEQLVTTLRRYSRPRLQELMGVSPKLADLNHQRYRDWSPPFTEDNSKPAILAFKGDVYHGFEFNDYSETDFAFAQEHLRILSGLYGVLRPLDLIQPYRLEMGAPLKTRRGKDLYAFWNTDITGAINDTLTKQEKSSPPGGRVLVNLASNEYFSSIHQDRLDARVITPVFKDFKNGKYKFMSFYGKKARGMMANFIVRNQIDDPDDLKEFGAAGYYFAPEASDGDTLTFLRDTPE